MSTRPLVSIGMPLYNAEAYLRESLEALLAQDYSNFEIIISDNASGDKTEAICREYTARDPRIRYFRAERNMGAVWNFRRVYELSRGEYFMWAAFDDVRDPRYVRLCVDALERNPNAALCCTGIRVIDEQGDEVGEEILPRGRRPVGSTVRHRVGVVAQSVFWFDFYGLTRRRVLAQTRLPQPVWGFDVIQLLELCLQGEVVAVPEQLFSYRYFRKKTLQDLAEILVPEVEQGRIPVNWGHFSVEMARSIWLAPLPLTQRLSLIIFLLREFCFRNPLVSENLRRESLSSVKAAYAQGKYRLTVELFTIAAVVILADAPATLLKRLMHLLAKLLKRLKASVHYRTKQSLTAFRKYLNWM
jgi:glycosyltransferase involved in cell wall biosynthesis